jgi:23S rRNA (adenine2503-C2)-methyltransferase
LLPFIADSAAQEAQRLAQLLRGIRCKVNVIPFNPHPGSAFQRPSEAEIERFQHVLQEHGLQINVRRPRGDDIQAACGQLQGEESKHRPRPEPIAAAAS